MKLKEKISSLIDILKDTDIDEIEISSFWGAQKIRVSNKKDINNHSIISTQLDNSIKTEKMNESEVKTNTIKDENIVDNDISNYQTIKAPLVGTYYSSPKPDAPTFINVGDKIQKGQIICIIEAMKIFNEIESDYSGTVVEILIENGKPVEFDQDLMIIK